MGNSNQAWAPLMRKRIEGAEIEKRLVSHIHALKCDIETGAENPNYMTQSQVTAALGLLRKVLPDLSAQTVDANIKGDLNVIVQSFKDGSDTPA